jgi:putrescine transport system permease protein
MKSKLSVTSLLSLTVGYAFLYIPILLVMVFSFNASHLVGVWGGFSTRWYHALFHNTYLLRAAAISFKIATCSATGATLLGTLGALLMVRFRRFPGRTLFNGMINTPLVMPDVIIGLALLLMFILFEQMMGWPYGRGMTTVTIAHITVGMAYVVVIVRARLLDFDRSLEEAALDLGATPTKVFLMITLPLIAPALGAGWLLSFALSLDDLVIASFVAGPGSTTLPMIVFSSIRLGVTPEINALGTLIITGVALCVSVAGFLMHRQVVGSRFKR